MPPYSNVGTESVITAFTQHRTPRMDTKERIQAANALVQWFNSQDIAPFDAAAIMSKVLAKILVGALGAKTNAQERRALDNLVDTAMLQLVHDMNDQLFHARRH